MAEAKELCERADRLKIEALVPGSVLEYSAACTGVSNALPKEGWVLKDGEVQSVSKPGAVLFVWSCQCT